MAEVEASFEFFEWTGNELILNIPEVLLVPEFENIFKLGADKAWDYFKFIYLVHNIKSPYREYSEKERFVAAQEDAALSDDEVQGMLMVVAVEKYLEIKDSSVAKMLKAAKRAVDKLREYFDTVDLSEKDDKNRPVYKATDLINQFKNLGSVHIGLQELEKQVKQEMSMSKGIRGDNEEGYNN